MRVRAVLRRGGKSRGTEKRVNARLGGGTRAMLRMRGSGNGNSVDRISTVRVQTVSFRPFTFHVGSGTLPRLVRKCGPRAGGPKEPRRRGFSPCERVARRRRHVTLRTIFKLGRRCNCGRLRSTLVGACVSINMGLGRGGTMSLVAVLHGGQVVIRRANEGCAFVPSFRC